MYDLSIIINAFIADIRLLIIGRLNQSSLIDTGLFNYLRSISANVMFIAGIILCTIRLLLNLARIELYALRLLIKPFLFLIAYQIYSILSAINQAISDHGVSDKGLEIIYGNIPFLVCYLVTGLATTVYYALTVTGSSKYLPQLALYNWNDMAWIRPACIVVDNHGIVETGNFTLSERQPCTASNVLRRRFSQGEGPQGLRVPHFSSLLKLNSTLTVILSELSVYSTMDRTLSVCDQQIAKIIGWYAGDIPNFYSLPGDQTDCVQVNQTEIELQSKALDTDQQIVVSTESEFAAQGSSHQFRPESRVISTLPITVPTVIIDMP